MDRKIKVTIFDKDYQLMASSEHQEMMMRRAAESVTHLARKYAESFNGGDEKDVLIFTAFNVCLQNLTYREEIKKLQDEADVLEKEFKAYLDKID